MEIIISVVLKTMMVMTSLSIQICILEIWKYSLHRLLLKMEFALRNAQ